jgi:hypothetical protein
MLATKNDNAPNEKYGNITFGDGAFFVLKPACIICKL